MSNWKTWENANIEDWKVALVTESHIFYCNFADSDENSSTKMYTRKMELVSDNYFATEALLNQMEDVYNNQLVVYYMAPEVISAIEFKANNGEYRKLEMKQSLIELVKELGFENILCSSFEEARANGRKKNIVVIEDSDIYLTYKHDNKFGEFVAWVEDEFLEDKSIYENVKSSILYYYTIPEEELDMKIENDKLFFNFEVY